MQDVEDDRVKYSQNYYDKLLNIVKNVMSRGTEFLIQGSIVQNVHVIVPKRFESTISSLENFKDLSIITLTRLLYALRP